MRFDIIGTHLLMTCGNTHFGAICRPALTQFSQTHLGKGLTGELVVGPLNRLCSVHPLHHQSHPQKHGGARGQTTPERGRDEFEKKAASEYSHRE